MLVFAVINVFDLYGNTYYIFMVAPVFELAYYSHLLFIKALPAPPLVNISDCFFMNWGRRVSQLFSMVFQRLRSILY